MTARGGRLVLVVGPSGAGKDSLLRHAMAHFAGDARMVFPRRLVTRAVDTGAEDHDSVDPEAFAEIARTGGLALSWEAHGLQYGIRREIEAQLAEGRIVVVNVSRTILDRAARDYPDAVIAEISAEPHLRAARIAARGRETLEDAERRSQRNLPLPPVALPIHVIHNNSAIKEAGAMFCQLLRSLPPISILFLCTGNTARSIIAESLLRKLGAGRFQSYSAGSQPKGSVNPVTLEVLSYHDFPTDGLRSKSWTEFAGESAPVMRAVITVCDNAAGEMCPIWPGHPTTAHWGIPDPHDKSSFARAYAMLRARTEAMVALDFNAPDLIARLREIGQP